MSFVKHRVKFLREEEERHQWRFAQLQSTIVNFSGTLKKGKSVSAKDFMPRKPQTTKQMLKQVEMLNALFGGEDKRVQNGSS